MDCIWPDILYPTHSNNEGKCAAVLMKQEIMITVKHVSLLKDVMKIQETS